MQVRVLPFEARGDRYVARRPGFALSDTHLMEIRFRHAGRIGSLKGSRTGSTTSWTVARRTKLIRYAWSEAGL
jgi:hypothetical protein